MARAVTAAIERPGHLVVEAGTGVGKSFAYLVPSILAAVHQKKKIVISTHTIALQEQLLSKDIPFLQSVMEEEFTAVLVKGRSNYVSLRRLNVAIQRQDSLFQRVEETDQLATLPPVVGKDHRRQSRGPQLQAVSRRLGRRPERGRQLYGPRLPYSRELLLLSGQAAGSSMPISSSSTTLCSSPTWRYVRRVISVSCPNMMWRFSTKRIHSKRSPASISVCKSPAWVSISG